MALSSFRSARGPSFAPSSVRAVVSHSRSLCLQLHTVPALDLILEHGIDQTVLLDHRQALELYRHNVQGVHASTTSTNILNLFYTLVSFPLPFSYLQV
jgi:hypothetical protein